MKQRDCDFTLTFSEQMMVSFKLNSVAKRSRVGESTLIDLISFSWVPRDFFLIMRSHHPNVEKQILIINGCWVSGFFNELDMILATKLNM
jgi:hypothetical protein